MYRAFGDLEANDSIKATYMNNIKQDYDPKRRHVYLGDLYNPFKSAESIALIREIMNFHHTPIKSIFTKKNIHTRGFIKQKFTELYELMNMHIYDERTGVYFTDDRTDASGKVVHIPYYNDMTHNYVIVPRRSKVVYDLSEEVPVYVYGNKELYFVLDIVNGEITCPKKLKHCIKVVHKTKFGDTYTNIINVDELNIMYSYLSVGRHYFYADNTVYIHCYQNARHLIDAFKFDKIVCGHHKGRGIFVDPELSRKHPTKSENMLIFMNDYTGIDTDKVELPSKLYVDITNGKINMHDNRCVQPCLRTIRPIINIDEEEDVSVSTHDSDESTSDIIVFEDSECFKSNLVESFANMKKSFMPVMEDMSRTN